MMPSSPDHKAPEIWTIYVGPNGSACMKGFAGTLRCPENYQEVEVGDALVAERLAEALREILLHGKTHDRPCWAIHNGDCADVFQEIARTALEAYEGNPDAPHDGNQGLDEWVERRD